MIRLRYSDTRLQLLCDTTSCLAHLVADEGTLDQQHAQLATLADRLGWRRTKDVGDYCEVHALELPEPIERGCTVRTWCVLREGHPGKCEEAARKREPETDFGPRAATKRRWG